MTFNLLSRSKAFLLTTAFGLASLAASAQTVPNPASGDIFIGFRASDGDGASSSYLVKVGNYTQLSAVSIGSTITLPGLGNLGNDLSATYGANWSTRPTLHWGAFGIGSSASAILYGSRERSAVSPDPEAWPALTDITRASTHSQINSVLNSIGGYRSGSTTANSAVATVQSNFSGAASYNYQVATSGTTDFGSVSQWTSIEGSFGAGASGTGLDLFRTTSAGVFRLGTFSISSGGALTFTARSSAPAGPQITTHPANFTGYFGGTASFSVIATGPGLTYQWRKGTAPLTDGPTVSGATSDTLFLTNLQAPAAGNYNVVVTNTTSSATSNDATLTVSELPSPPQISSAASASGVVGKPFSYQIVASNSPTSYNATGLPGGLAIDSATGLISGSPTTAGISTVSLSATNAGGTGNASLEITNRALASIEANPQPQTPVEGGTATFAVTATGDGLTFQWRKDDVDLEDGENISGATTPTLVITNATIDDEGVYTVVITNAAGDAISTPVELTLDTEVLVSNIAVIQAGKTLVNGTSVIKFGSIATGASGKPLVFTIRNDGEADLSELSVSLSGANPGDYTVTQPVLSTVAEGASTTFSVTFKPKKKGARAATISIASNDSADDPFVIGATGTGITPQPEIALEQPAKSGLVSGKGSKSFGTAVIGKVGRTLTFTIRNEGSANLSGLRVTVAGKHASDFIPVNPTKTTLTPGATVAFKVKFKPSAKGTRTAELRVASNDADENPFKTNLGGTGATK